MPWFLQGSPHVNLIWASGWKRPCSVLLGNLQSTLSLHLPTNTTMKSCFKAYNKMKRKQTTLKGSTWMALIAETRKGRMYWKCSIFWAPCLAFVLSVPVHWFGFAQVAPPFLRSDWGTSQKSCVPVLRKVVIKLLRVFQFWMMFMFWDSPSAQRRLQAQTQAALMSFSSILHTISVQFGHMVKELLLSTQCNHLENYLLQKSTKRRAKTHRELNIGSMTSERILTQAGSNSLHSYMVEHSLSLATNWENIQKLGRLVFVEHILHSPKPNVQKRTVLPKKRPEPGDHGHTCWKRTRKNTTNWFSVKPWAGENDFIFTSLIVRRLHSAHGFFLCCYKMVGLRQMKIVPRKSSLVLVSVTNSGLLPWCLENLGVFPSVKSLQPLKSFASQSKSNSGVSHHHPTSLHFFSAFWTGAVIFHQTFKSVIQSFESISTWDSVPLR